MAGYPHKIALWQRMPLSGDNFNQGRYANDKFITNITGLVFRIPYAEDPQVVRLALQDIRDTNRTAINPAAPKMFGLMVPPDQVSLIHADTIVNEHRLYFTPAENEHNPFGIPVRDKPDRDSALSRLDHYLRRVFNIMSFQGYRDYAHYRITDGFMYTHSPLR